MICDGGQLKVLGSRPFRLGVRGGGGGGGGGGWLNACTSVQVVSYSYFHSFPLAGEHLVCLVGWGGMRQQWQYHFRFGGGGGDASAVAIPF